MLFLNHSDGDRVAAERFQEKLCLYQVSFNRHSVSSHRTVDLTHSASFPPMLFSPILKDDGKSGMECQLNCGSEEQACFSNNIPKEIKDLDSLL